MIEEKDYRLIKKLGEGAYGAVYQAYSFKLQKEVAIKIIKVQDQDDGIPYTTLREFTVLKKLNTLTHPNILKLHEVNFAGFPLIKEVHLCCQLMDQDLGKFIKTNPSLSLPQRKAIFLQIVKGLIKLEKNRIFHRDIKPQNILINKQNEVKIGDFGLSRIATPKFSVFTKQIQTLWYRAPQLILGSERYDYGVDIWSLGCVFFEIIEGSVLFRGDSEIGQIFKIFNYLGTPRMDDFEELKKMKNFKSKFPKMRGSLDEKVTKLDSSGQTLLRRMVQIIPCKRISLYEILEHKYFDDMYI